MRYHWGLGIGHTHAHQPTFNAGQSPDKSNNAQDDRSTDFEPDEPSGGNAADTAHVGEGDASCKSDNPELCLDDHDMEGWDDVETDSAEGSADDSTDSDSVDGSADDSDGERDLDHDSIEDFGWM
jgi:hypothetical protein